MIAQQVAGKATRDALFLSNFTVRLLPAMMAGSAVLSLVAVLWLSRMMLRHSPAKVVPAAFGASSVVLLLAWALSFGTPRLAAVVLYIDTALFGAAVISSFWSLVNETFDAHASRLSVAAITSGGTLGGLLGGLMAWRAAALIEVPTMLPLLAALNLVSLWGSLRLKARPAAEPAESEPVDPGGPPSPVSILRESPYLGNLAMVVALGAVTSGLLDYVFSAEAARAFANGRALLAFFSLFWVVVGALSLALQLLFGRLALEKLGLAVTLAILPGIVILGGAAGLAVPGLASTAMLRGAEATHRNSLFRMAYELLYTPVSERRKRATKTLIDVGFDRLGTVTAALTTSLALALAAAHAEAILLVVAVLGAIVSLGRSRALHAGYVQVLEEGLRKRGESAAPASPPAHEGRDVRDKIVERLEVLSSEPARADERMTGRTNAGTDAWLLAIAHLRSRDPARVRGVLSAVPLARPLVGFAILLLADKEFQLDAVRALRVDASNAVGQFVDALCDARTDFDIRRRIPRVLSTCTTQCAVDGLILGTADPRFEVRYQCGRALTKICCADARIVIPEATVIAIVKRELALSREAWESLPAADADEEEENEPPALIDRLLQDRVDRGIDYVFTLLALVLDRESLRLAFKALHEKDDRRRGTALEYLETVLPDDIRDAVWPFLGEARPMRAARPATEILADLRRASNASQDLPASVTA